MCCSVSGNPCFLWLHDMPLYGSAASYFFIHQLVAIWVVSTMRLLWIMLLWTRVPTFPLDHVCSVLPVQTTYLSVAVWGTARVLSSVGSIIVHSHQQCIQTPVSPNLCQHLLLSVFYSYSSGGWMVSHCDFDLYFHNDCLWWASFHVLHAYLHIFSGGKSIQVLCPFLNWAVCLFIVEL